MPCTRKVQLSKRFSHMRKRSADNIPDAVWRRCHTERHPKDCRCKDADENCAVNIARHQRRCKEQTKEREQRRRQRHMSERDIGRGVLHNESCPLKADKCDKETDANADCQLQITRHSVDDCLTNSADGQNQEESPREEYRTERNRPMQTENPADIICEERIEPHTGRERDRIIRKNPHGHGGKRRNPNGRGNCRFLWNPRIGENIRIDEQDIRHCNKSRHAREQLCPEG